MSIPAESALGFQLPYNFIASEAGVLGTTGVYTGVSSSDTLILTSAVSFFKLEIKDSDVISVSIKGKEAETFNGNVVSYPSSPSALAENGTVSIKPKDKYLQPGEYFIPVSPVSFKSGVEVTLNTEDVKIRFDQSESVDLPRNSGKELDLSGAHRLPFVIKTASGLKEFAEKASQYSSGDIVKIEEDLDMSGIAWKPFSPICTLDGQGHKIFNLTISTSTGRCGFVETLKEGGALKNLVFGSSDGIVYDGVSSIEYTGTAASYLGLAGDCQGTIENVKSFVAINHSANDPGNRIGGIVGCVEGKGTVAGSEFAGAITLGDNSASLTHFVGGIAGRTHGNLPDNETISNCTFSGSIICKDSKVQGIGGIVGIMNGGNIDNCTSSGKITYDKGSNSNYGGIVSYIQNSTNYVTTISSCTSSTAFSTAQYMLSVGGIAGQFQWGSKAAEINSCTNNADLCATVSGQTKLGGIAGYVQDKTSVVHTVENCVNNGNISYSGAKEAYLGGILGSGSTTGTKISGFKFKDNTNNGNISISTETVKAAAGGVFGFCYAGAVVLKDNVNKGAVSVFKTDTKTDNAELAGGIFGWLKGSASQATPNTITLTNDKNLGTITSSNRAASIFTALAGSTYVSMTLNNCGVGGKVGTGGAATPTTVTSGNYADYIKSWTDANYHTITGTNTCKYVSE